MKSLLSGLSSDGNPWKTSSAPKQAAGKKYWSPDGGAHYAFEAGGEQMFISAETYSHLGTAKVNARFVNGNEVQVTEGPGEFTVRRIKPDTITINSFIYPLRLASGGAASDAGTGDFFSNVLSSTASAVEGLALQVEGNLFTRPISDYPSLLRELHSYQGNVYKYKSGH